MLYGWPESLTGDKKLRAMFSKEFSWKNTIRLQLFEMRYIQLFIGKYADLFTRKGATLNSLWGVWKGENGMLLLWENRI